MGLVVAADIVRNVLRGVPLQPEPGLGEFREAGPEGQQRGAVSDPAGEHAERAVPVVQDGDAGSGGETGAREGMMGNIGYDGVIERR